MRDGQREIAEKGEPEDRSECLKTKSKTRLWWFLDCHAKLCDQCLQKILNSKSSNNGYKSNNKESHFIY